MKIHECVIMTRNGSICEPLSDKDVSFIGNTVITQDLLCTAIASAVIVAVNDILSDIYTKPLSEVPEVHQSCLVKS